MENFPGYIVEYRLDNFPQAVTSKFIKNKLGYVISESDVEIFPQEFCYSVKRGFDNFESSIGRLCLKIKEEYFLCHLLEDVFEERAEFFISGISKAADDFYKHYSGYRIKAEKVLEDLSQDIWTFMYKDKHRPPASFSNTIIGLVMDSYFPSKKDRICLNVDLKKITFSKRKKEDGLFYISKSDFKTGFEEAYGKEVNDLMRFFLDVRKRKKRRLLAERIDILRRKNVFGDKYIEKHLKSARDIIAQEVCPSVLLKKEAERFFNE